MQTIKIDTRGKGENHHEKYLLEKQEIRLRKLLVELDIDPWTKRKVFKLFKSKVTNKNITKVTTHPIKGFLRALLQDNIDELETYTSSPNFK